MIKDIVLSNEFYADWDRVTNVQARKSFDKLIRIISTTQHLPKSMQVHKVIGHPTIWIGYVTLSRCAFRIFYTLEGGILYIIRFVPHIEEDTVLKSFDQEVYSYEQQ
jgi:hypothetical protein